MSHPPIHVYGESSKPSWCYLPCLAYGRGSDCAVGGAPGWGPGFWLSLCLAHAASWRTFHVLWLLFFFAIMGLNCVFLRASRFCGELFFMSKFDFPSL